jgi:uncharacterized protein (TIGR02996 family)
MTEQESFLLAIAEHPDDDMPRLVYADWLEDHGDPERAEFIRVQVELARGVEDATKRANLEEREQELRKLHKYRWIDPHYGNSALIDVDMYFERGFITDFEPKPEMLNSPHFGTELRQYFPIDTLHLPPINEKIASVLAEASELRYIQQIIIYNDYSREATPDDAKALQILLKSPHLANLKGFFCRRLGLSEAEYLALASSLSFSSVRKFRIYDENITARAIAGFVAHFPNLQIFSLAQLNGLDPEEFGQIARSMTSESLQKLSLTETLLSSQAIRAFFATDRFPNLKELDLSNCSIDASSMGVLMENICSSSVTRINLGNNPISDQGARSLASWPGLSSVTHLELYNCDIGSDGCRAILQSPHLGKLTHLYLSSNEIADDGIEALGSDQFSHLQSLTLDDNLLTNAGIITIASSPYMGKLEELHFTGRDINEVDEKGFEYLITSPYLSALQCILASTVIVSFATILRAIERFPRLQKLSIYSDDDGYETIQRLREAIVSDKPQMVADYLVEEILKNPKVTGRRENYGSYLFSNKQPWWSVIAFQTQHPSEYFDPSWHNSTPYQQLQDRFEAQFDELVAPLKPWIEPLHRLQSFDRGFLRKVHFTKRLPDEVAESLARFPGLAMLPFELQRGRMTGEGAFQILTKQSYFSKMKRLEFVSVKPTELAILLDSPCLSGLMELALGHCLLGDDIAELLANSSALTSLCTLDFGWRLDGTRRVREANNRLSANGMRHLVNSPFLKNLDHLGLEDNLTLGMEGFTELLHSPLFQSLRSLDIRSIGLPSTALQLLSHLPPSSSLKQLRLGGFDSFTWQDLQAFRASPFAQNLANLEIVKHRRSASQKRGEIASANRYIQN